MNNNSDTNENDGQSRGARKRARTRTELLTAARKVFALRGYHDASIVEITQEADIGVGTFYLHFRDKDEIFSTVLEEGFNELREQIAGAILRKASEPITLTIFIHAVFQCAYAQRELFQITLTARSQHARGRAFRAQATLAEYLTSILENNKHNGMFTETEIPLLARLIAGVIIQGIFWWFENDEPGPDELTALVLRLLRHGLPASLFTELEES